jgi:prophage regulatory protein
MSRRANRSNTSNHYYSANSAKKRPRRIMRLRAVMAKTGWSKSAIYTKIAAGLFPAPVHLLDGKASIWDENEIDDIVEAAFAKRDEVAQ